MTSTSSDISYALLDSGHGRKLEKFGAYILDRPCGQAVWRPRCPVAFWSKADARFIREQKSSHWEFRHPLPKSWPCRIGDILFQLQATDFGHVGVFPEHLLGWKLMKQFASLVNPAETSVLNLFAYSGGASIAAAKTGFSVCHLDASKKMMDWARENARLNDVENSIRWITDDVQKFLAREIRRGRKYQGIILDPPSFGRGTNLELFQIDSSMEALMDACKQVLDPQNPLFILLSCHTPGYTPIVLSNLLEQTCPAGNISCGEMQLPNRRETAWCLPNGAYSLWTSSPVSAVLP